jgi:CheY-like chemotaxis protein
VSTDLSRKRFLVIDDQAQARDALRTIAQTAGAFAVEFAATYQDALYRIRNNTPDVILCDYMLGEGRSGQQLLEELRRFDLLPDETIFMMVTGEQTYEQVVSAVELVPDDYIIKPFSPDKLLLRLERIVARKSFSPTITARSGSRTTRRRWPACRPKLGSEAGRPYRFEILRQRAETLLASGDPAAAETAYRGILDSFDFPWAHAGVARALHRQDRLAEAREEIDRVVAGTPNYFDAADLKAQICLAQGDAGEAQRVLDDAAQRTPRNYLRKRLLAEAAALNGDADTARAVLADVVANDTMPGAVTPEDRLQLARSQVDARDLVSAERVLLGLRESEAQNMALDEQASFSALLAVASPEKGKPRFAGLRPALLAAELRPDTRLDLVRGALEVRDSELADRQAAQLLGGGDVKRVFAMLRKLYVLYGREVDFRELQKQIALRRIHHE